MNSSRALMTGSLITRSRPESAKHKQNKSSIKVITQICKTKTKLINQKSRSRPETVAQIKPISISRESSQEKRSEKNHLLNANSVAEKNITNPVKSKSHLIIEVNLERLSLCSSPYVLESAIRMLSESASRSSMPSDNDDNALNVREYDPTNMPASVSTSQPRLTGLANPREQQYNKNTTSS